MTAATEQQNSTVGTKKQRLVTFNKVHLKESFSVGGVSREEASLTSLRTQDNSQNENTQLVVHKNAQVTLEGMHLQEYDHIYLLVSSIQGERIEDLQLWENKSLAGTFSKGQPSQVTFELPDLDTLIEAKASLFVILKSSKKERNIRPILLSEPALSYFHTDSKQEQEAKKKQKEAEDQKDAQVSSQRVRVTGKPEPVPQWQKKDAKTVSFTVVSHGDGKIVLEESSEENADNSQSEQVDVDAAVAIPFALGNSNVTGLLSLLTAEKQADAQAVALALAAQVSKNLGGVVTARELFEDQRYKDLRLVVLQEMSEAGGVNAVYDADDLHAVIAGRFKNAYPDSYELYRQSQLRQVFADPVMDPALRTMLPEIHDAIDVYFSNVPPAERNNEDLRTYLTQTVSQEVWLEFTEKFPEKSLQYATKIPELTQFIRENIYIKAEQDPMVKQLEQRIQISVNTEMREVSSVKSGIAAPEQSRYKSQLAAATRKDQLVKFALEFPAKAAAYQTQIPGLQEVLQTGALSAVNVPVNQNEGIVAGGISAAVADNKIGYDAALAAQSVVKSELAKGNATGNNTQSEQLGSAVHGMPEQLGQTISPQGISPVGINPTATGTATGNQPAGQSKILPRPAPLAQAQDIFQKAKQIPKASNTMDGIRKAAAAGEAVATAIPHAEAQKFASILAKVKNADLRGHSPLSKADKSLQLAREISALAGKSAMAERIGQVHEGFKEISPLAEDIQQSFAKNSENSGVELNADVKFARNAERIQKVLKVTEKVAQLTGQEDIAAMAAELGGAAAAADGKKSGTGGNIVGAQAARIARDFPNSSTGKLVNKGLGKLGRNPLVSGLSKGTSSVLGGAVAGAMQGEGSLGIAQNALSWYVVDIAVGSLLTPWSPVALIYLNFHYLASKFGSRWFRKPSLWQSLTILFANFAYIAGIILIFLLLMVTICNNPLYKVASLFSGQAKVCQYFDATNLGKAIGNKIVSNTTGSFQCSGQYCTNQWDNQVQQYASAAGIDACVLKTVVEKESHGNPNAIGHDAHNGSQDPFQASQPPQYGLDWSHSHGIGLTQWTIFPQSGSNRWIDSNTPSISLTYLLSSHQSQWYTVADFLNPDISLQLTARRFAVNLTQNNENMSAAFGLLKAFGDYNGSGASGTYAQDAVRLYSICKGNTASTP